MIRFGLGRGSHARYEVGVFDGIDGLKLGLGASRGHAIDLPERSDLGHQSPQAICPECYT